MAKVIGAVVVDSEVCKGCNSLCRLLSDTDFGA